MKDTDNTIPEIIILPPNDLILLIVILSQYSFRNINYSTEIGITADKEK